MELGLGDIICMMNIKIYYVKVINIIRKVDFVEYKRIFFLLELKCLFGL